MGDWIERLEVRGRIAVVTNEAITAWERAQGQALPGPVRAMLTRLGPGRLLGVYDVPSPLEPLWTMWRANADDWRKTGYFAGFSAAEWERLFIFAADARGNALAISGLPNGHAFFLLMTTGSVVDLGSSPDAFLDRLLETCPWTFDRALPKSAAEQILEPCYVDLGIEPCWVCAGDAREAWLQGLVQGREPDVGLEGAIGAEPLVLSYIHLAQALCSDLGGPVPAAARNEALDLLARLAKRREPALFEAFLPPSLLRRADVTDPAVRAWAARPHPLDLPEGGVRAKAAEGPVIEPLDDTLRLPLEAPSVDVEATLSTWLNRWRPDDRAAATAYFDRCRTAAPALAFGIVRRVQWLTPGGPFLSRPLGDTRKQLGADDDSPAMQARTEDVLAQLATHRLSAWPFFILCLPCVPGRAGGRLISLLTGTGDADAAEALLWLVENGWHGDAAARAWLHDRPRVPDAAVDRLLPVLTAPSQDGSEEDVDHIVTCLAKAIDRDKVYEAFLECFARSPIRIICALAERDGPRTRAFLHKHLKHRSFDVRHTCAQVLVELGDPAGKAALDRIVKAAEREERRNRGTWGN